MKKEVAKAKQATYDEKYFIFEPFIGLKLFFLHALHSIIKFFE